jgi:murein DD-endopeptidase MepM/ murein hydrolase activator NlpD
MTATASVFTWPVNGSVLREYGMETLAYDQTMGDWRTHDGVDIAASAGTQVMAPAGGTVVDLYQDDLMGSTVVILHADGVMSACANLAAVPTVEVGDTVRTGDVIGSVGATALAESGEASHLHLSMTKNGVSVDPLGYLPEK